MTMGNMIGNLLAILSGFTFAVMIVALRFQKDASPIESTLMGNLITFLVTIPFIAKAPMPDLTSIIGLILLGYIPIGFLLHPLCQGHQVCHRGGRHIGQCAGTSLQSPLGVPLHRGASHTKCADWRNHRAHCYHRSIHVVS